MKMNKLQRSINTSTLVIVFSIIFTFILSIYKTNFICLLIPICFSYIVLLLFDIIFFYINNKFNKDESD